MAYVPKFAYDMGRGLQEASYGLGFMPRPPPNFGALAADTNKLAEEDWKRNMGMTQSSPFGTTTPIYDQNGNIIGRNTSLNPGDQASLDQSRQNTGYGLWQARNVMGSDYGFGGVPGLSTGEEYRQRAEDAIYNRGARRLDSRFGQ